MIQFNKRKQTEIGGKAGQSQEAPQNKHEKLACLFYSLASIYYIFQLVGMLISNFPAGLDLTSMLDAKVVNLGLQFLTLFIVFLRRQG